MLTTLLAWVSGPGRTGDRGDRLGRTAVGRPAMRGAVGEERRRRDPRKAFLATDGAADPLEVDVAPDDERLRRCGGTPLPPTQSNRTASPQRHLYHQYRPRSLSRNKHLPPNPVERRTNSGVVERSPAAIPDQPTSAAV